MILAISLDQPLSRPFLPLGAIARRLGKILRIIEAPFRWASHHIRDGSFAWLRGAYLTLRYVDEYTVFPAIQFADRYPRLAITKEPGSKLVLRGPLLLRNNHAGKHPYSSIHLQTGSRMEVNGGLHIGSNVQFRLAPRARIVMEGAGPGIREKYDYSGFQGDCFILIKESFYMGKNTGISWRCDVMDSDWHPTNGKLEAFPVWIGNHVWVVPGAKILKGARIGDDSIVGRDALVLGGTYAPQSFIAGIPATRKGTAPVWRYEWYEW